MRKRLLLLAGIFILLAQTVLAQTVDVSGRVTDNKGESISGVSVTEKGTRNGTTTNADGNFKIQVKSKATLVFTSIGYTRKEVAVSGNTVNLSLESASESISEVVVTSLGIRREKKALGYSVATVDKKDLELRPDGDVIRILNGKAPGVDIQNVSGISGSGTNIVIRGINSITGGSTPFFVVDGTPFDPSTNPQANFVYGNTSSSRFLDLDPNNIESISVLKGLSATTLYGELGRNGVVVITTKNAASRKINKKLEVSVSQSLFQNKVANLPVYQDTYGGGYDQSLGLAFFSNWGAKFTDPPAQVNHPYSRAALNTAFPEFVGAKYDYKPYNSVERFFRTGWINTTAVNVASSGTNTTFNANYSYMDDEGFTPGNRVFKNSFGAGGSAKLNNNISIGATFNYSTTDFKSPPTSTSFGSNPSTSSVFGNLIYTPRAVDLIGLPWENPLDKSSVYYRNGNDIQNPFWTVKNGANGQKVNRLYGNLLIKYDILKNLNVSYRIGFDDYSDFNYLAQNKGGTVGGSDYTLGIYRTVAGRSTILSHNFITTWNTNFLKDFNLNLEGGVTTIDKRYEQNGQKSTQQLVYGLFDHDNFIVHDNKSEDGSGLDYKSQYLSIGAFTQALVGYKDFLYVTLGGRNSWVSNLEKENRSLFYPSANVSFIPTSVIESLKGNKNINYLKIRAGYSTSANFGSPYTTRPTLNIATNVFSDRIGTTINVNSVSNRLANPNLAPELLRETELGLEGRFIDSRLSLDFTFYRRVSHKQILDRDLDPSSGYTVTSINAGSVRNMGFEVAMGYTVIRNKNWRWQLDGNFTRNRNKVYDLPADIKQIVVGGFSNEGLFAINGQPLGIIQGSYSQKYVKAGDPANGQRLVDENGNYIASTGIGIIGDPTPDYKMTGISTLGFKGFSFRMQWDFTKGGKMLAYTPGTLVGRGLTKDTEFDRLLPWILPGVKADGTPNDIQTSTSEIYFSNMSGFFGLADLITYDATVIRLREASLSYSLPSTLLSKTPFGSIQLSVSGRNLFYYAPNFPKYTNFDPETSSLGVSNVRGLEYLSGPTSRRIGVSLRVTF